MPDVDESGAEVANHQIPPEPEPTENQDSAWEEDDDDADSE